MQCATITTTGFDRICRTCMAESPAQLSLFEQHAGPSGSASEAPQTIGELLRLFTTIAPDPDDGLPQRICFGCLSEINQAVSFKQKCERSESTMRRFLQQMQPNPIIEMSTVNDCKEPAAEEEFVIPDYIDYKQCVAKVPTKSLEDFDVIDQQRPIEEPTAACLLPDDFGTPEEYQIVDLTAAGDNGIEAEFLDTVDELDGEIEYIDHENDDDEESSPSIGADEATTAENNSSTAANNDTRTTMQQPVHPHPDPVARTTTATGKLHCVHCSATFVDELSLTNHQKLNLCTVPTFECAHCQRVFVHAHNLRTHVEQTHSAAALARTCPECGERFADTAALHAHRATDASCQRRVYRCTHCARAFGAASSLRDHLRTHTGDRPFLCSVCGKRFSQRTNLKQHALRHTQLRPFACAHCPKQFVSKGELGQHELTHSGRHPHRCEHCGSAFTTSSSLVKHRRQHTGERPYACEYCPMRFAALGTLKNHRRTHTGERPFKCAVCPRAFAQHSDCRAHEKKHGSDDASATSRRKFCTRCGKSFAKANTLTAHMETCQQQRGGDGVEMEMRETGAVATSRQSTMAEAQHDETEEE